MKRIVLGTAGHIDHGKTTLIKALTGVDCDRLKEEKERGITIELGFTSMILPSGITISIVDVPGHEKFVRHMVAGATGIDLVALVIAADEGIMPQTREHLDICKLLRVKKGLIALTKIDLVEKDWLDMVKEEIQDFVKGTFLQGGACVPLSSTTGEGLPAFVAEVDRLAKEAEERSPEGLLRLPIDRVFTIKGFGTVATGTIISGTVSIGDTLEVLPKGLEAKVRGIQAHGKSVESATAGLRAGINLQGLEKDIIDRGNVLTISQTLKPTVALDVIFQLLSSAPKPLKNRARVRWHLGTVEALGRVILLDREEVKSGEEVFLQIRLEQPVTALPGDRFVARSYSPIFTIGGGEVLDAFPSRHKRFSSQVKEEMEILQKGSEEEKLRLRLLKAGPKGLSWPELIMRANVLPLPLKSLIERLISTGGILRFNGDRLRYIHPQVMADLKRSCLDYLREFHQKNPLQPGAVKEEVKTKLPPQMDARLFNHLLSILIEDKKIIAEKETIRLYTHAVSLKEEEKDLRKNIILIYAKAHLQPPTVKEALSELRALENELKPVLQLLTKEGTLVKVNEDLYFHRQALEELEGKIVRFLQENKEMNPTQFKDLSQVSRKFAIPLMEHFDAKKLTMRIGDKRVLRK
ncbi:MAG: selenocysteine-specific translation elongation factor [Deltaproteobacteria bacterium]|nr:selenocysteine-specific translation elongation factor [Deltaproteobacteria bacterium]